MPFVGPLMEKIKRLERERDEAREAARKIRRWTDCVLFDAEHPWLEEE